MRIIAGEARGRKLKSMKGLDTRPTADRVKEALFSILTPVLAGANFLDLFAGTGSIGMEAISRGAGSCVFVESRDICIRVIQENLALCGFSDRAQVWRGNALNFLKHSGANFQPYDLIYVDPPYDTGLVEKSLALIATGGWLSEEGWVIVEARKSSPEGNVSVDGLKIARQAVYGDTVLVFYHKAGMPEGDSS